MKNESISQKTNALRCPYCVQSSHLPPTRKPCMIIPAQRIHVLIHSFPNCIVIKEPPYQVSESGYGSFNLPIEVHFRNKDEPKKVRFEYDLLLPNLNDPPINQIRSECLTFQNPSEEFKSKLLKAGGVSTGTAPGNSSAPPPSQKVKRPADDGDLSHKKPLKAKKVKKGGDSSGSDTSSDSESDDQPMSTAPVSKSTKSGGQTKKSSPNTWDTAALKRLHKHLNSLQDPQRLQEIVNIIEQTGQYNLTQSTFDFDLCKLDDHTLSKLSKFMEGGGLS